MRVQLLPWQIAKTSISSASLQNTGKRRRIRNDEKQSSSEDDRLPNDSSLIQPIAASFVLPSRSSNAATRKKGRMLSALVVNPRNEDQMKQPRMILTTSHRVTVLGESVSSRSDHAETNPSYDWVESSMLQFRSHPGKSSSTFISTNDKIPVISAIWDDRFDRCYALTNDNMRLCCFASHNVDNVTLDDVPSTTHVDLASPAVSLSLPSSSSMRRNMTAALVYGSCQDGKIFLAYLDDEPNARWIVHYVSLEDDKSPFHVIGTLAHVIDINRSNALVTAGSKRKQSSDASPLQYRIKLCQIIQPTAQQQDVVVVSRQFQTSNHGKTWQPMSDSVKTVLTLVRDISTTTTAVQHPFHVQVIGYTTEPFAAFVTYSNPSHGTGELRSCIVAGESAVQEGKKDLSTVEMRTHRTPDKAHVFWRTIRLDCRQGVVASSLMQLPPGTKQIALVGSSYLAASTTQNDLILFDAWRGGCLDQRPMEEILGKSSPLQDFRIVGDVRYPIVALVYVKDNAVQVATSHILSDDGNILVTARPSLAASLATSVTMLPPSDMPNTKLVGVQHRLSMRDPVPGSCDVLKISAVEEATKLIHWTFSSETGVSNQNGTKNQLSHLLESFQRAIRLIVEAYDGIEASHTFDVIKIAGLSDLSSQYKLNGAMKNGLHRSIGKNGSKNEHLQPAAKHRDQEKILHLPKCLPRSFIEDCMDLIVAYLGRRKSLLDGVADDVRFMLKLLVRTGKLTIRNRLQHDSFVGMLRSITKLEGEKECVYSPFEFILDLRHFSDLSERYMVLAFQYIARHGSTTDIAKFFASSKRLDVRFDVKDATARFLTIQSSKDRVKLASNEIEEESALAGKLIVAGMNLFLTSVVRYSSCNDTLLRVALSDLLTMQELILLCRLFGKALSTKILSFAHTKTKPCRQILQWLSALFDCVRGPLPESDEATLLRLRRMVETEISKTESILTLQNTINSTLQTKQAVNQETGTSTRTESMQTEMQVSAYQVERLVI